jgi:hypothetical protein
VYLRFHGGKGVATGAGIVAVLLPVPFLAMLLTWIALVCTFRYISLGSIGASLALIACRLAATPTPFGSENRILTLFCLFAAILVITRHHANLRRLLHGTENRLKDSTAMLLITKIIHVLALGLWFGTAMFFTFVVALSLFRTFEEVATRGRDSRPSWLPLPSLFSRDAEAREEQGRRAAGTAISPLFDAYFAIQALAGLIALATSLAWFNAEPSTRLHQARVYLLTAAVVTVAGGWYVERRVSDLRKVREEKVDAVLSTPSHTDSVQQDAEKKARDTFAQWHTVSIFINLLTILLVTIAMALAAKLPGDVNGQVETPNSRLEPKT